MVSLSVDLLHAEPAGPPRPVASKTTPAEQAISRYDAQYGSRRAAECRGKAGEIVVCGNDARSPDRIPLPDERSPTPHAGEFAHVGIGTGPVPVQEGTTVARFGMGKTAKTRNATLKLIREQEEAKAAKLKAEAQVKQ